MVFSWLTYGHLLSVCPHGLSSVCVHGRRETAGLSLLLRTLILLDQSPTLTTSFKVNYFSEVPISKFSHIGVSTSIYEFEETQISPSSGDDCLNTWNALLQH